MNQNDYHLLGLLENDLCSQSHYFVRYDRKDSQCLKQGLGELGY